MLQSIFATVEICLRGGQKQRQLCFLSIQSITNLLPFGRPMTLRGQTPVGPRTTCARSKHLTCIKGANGPATATLIFFLPNSLSDPRSLPFVLSYGCLFEGTRNICSRSCRARRRGSLVPSGVAQTPGRRRSQRRRGWQLVSFCRTWFRHCTRRCAVRAHCNPQLGVWLCVRRSS